MKTRLCMLLMLSFAAMALAADPPAKKPEESKSADKTADKDVQSLFDGKKLGDWKVSEELGFKDHGKVEVEEGEIHLAQGDPYTGIVFGGKFPKIDYEISLEAKRTKGDDFFCGLTFPVGDDPLTLVVGGWGGTVVGFSNIDGMNASENTETHGMEFDKDRWYKIKLRVVKKNILLSIDDKEIIDFDTAEHKFDIYSSLDPMKPLGITTWNTGSAIRNITVRPVTEKKVEEKKVEKK